MKDVAIKKSEDLTGKSQMLRNTLISWGSHLVLVVSGFIMPRLVDEYVGAAQLGIWDFCWTLVNYLVLVGLGVGGSSNRFIAKARAEKDGEELNRILSTVIVIQFFVCTFIVVGTLLLIASFSSYFSEQLGEHLELTKQVMFFLGISLAITNFFSASRGVLTGFHRWDLHNSITAATSFVSLLLMLLMLFLGHGIVGMAIGYLIGNGLSDAIRAYLAYKYCRPLSPSWSLVSFEKFKEVMGYGIKCKLSTLPPVFLLQSVNVMIVAALGPAALAVFSRPLALTRHVSTFMAKFTMILTPSAGSMLQDDKKDELKQFFLMTTKLSFAFTLPMVIGLAITGDYIIGFWMGADYANWLVICILSLGALLPTAQDCSIRILMGMNLHGKISVYVSVLVFALFAFFYYSNIEITLTVAALALTVPMNIAYGILLPIYTCNKLNISLTDYFKKSLISPFLAIIPFTVLLLGSRYFFESGSHIYSLVCFTVAPISLVYLYALMVLSTEQRQKLLAKFIKSKD